MFRDTLLGLSIIIAFLRTNVPTMNYNTLPNSSRITLAVFMGKLLQFIADSVFLKHSLHTCLLQNFVFFSISTS